VRLSDSGLVIVGGLPTIVSFKLRDEILVTSRVSLKVEEPGVGIPEL
jgi:hypothetical protein